MERKLPKKVDRKRFVRYKEGAEMYSINDSKLRRAAIEQIRILAGL